MATAKKSSGKSSKQSAPTKEDKFVTLSIEMPAELLIMIDEFAKEDEISAPEELALMIQIGLQARLEDMVEIKKEKARLYGCLTIQRPQWASVCLRPASSSPL